MVSCADARQRDVCGPGTRHSAAAQSRAEWPSGQRPSLLQTVRSQIPPQPHLNRDQQQRRAGYQGLGRNNARAVLLAGRSLGPDTWCCWGRGVRWLLQAAAHRRCPYAGRLAPLKSSSLHHRIIAYDDSVSQSVQHHASMTVQAGPNLPQ